MHNESMKKSLSNFITRGKKSILLLFFIFSFTLFNFAQSNYEFTALSGTFTPLTGATVIPEIQTDEAISAPIDIGFNFLYNSVNYNQIVVSSNGFLSFNTNSGIYYDNDLANSPGRPLIAPLWDDLAGEGGSASYLLEGTAPNRILTVEWLYWKWPYFFTVSNISFQVKLYESTNQIEFIYRQEIGGMFFNAASMGLAFQGYGTNNFLSLQDAGSAPTASSTFENVNIDSKPATGQIYRFINNVVPEPGNHATNLNVRDSENGILVDWTDASGGILPDGYLLLASATNSFPDAVDGIDFTKDINLANGTGAIKIKQGVQGFSDWIGAQGNTTYYFKIYPYTNNGISIDYKTDDEVPTAQFSTIFYAFDQTEIPLSNLAYSSAAWGDYDNDGDLDLLITGYNGQYNSKIYKNNGNDAFEEQTDIFLTGSAAGSSAWGDYDNDGDLDILLTGVDMNDNSFSKIYRNNGNNTFDELFDIAITGVAYSSIAWADFDLDGDLDIILSGKKVIDKAASRYEPVTLIYNNVNGAFIESGVKLKAGDEVAIADYNNDNYADILISGRDINDLRSTSLYKNNGDNTFSLHTGNLFTGVSEGSMDWGDYNNDGYLDILLTGRSDLGFVSKVYKNNDGNTFSEQANFSLTGVALSSSTWIDYDNDGFQDIIISGLTGLNVDSRKVSEYYRNNGDNTFAKPDVMPLYGVSYGATEIGDYDNDGDLDLVLSGMLGINPNTYNVSRIFKNQSPVANTKPNVPANLKQSVVNQKALLSWDAASDLETPIQSLSYNIRVGSLPGASDIVSPMADQTNGTKKIPGMGNAFLNNNFILNNLNPGTYYWSVQTIDNGSLASSFSEEQSFTILPLFVEQPYIPYDGVTVYGMDWGDYDNDGDLDLALSGSKLVVFSPTAFLSIYKNEGNNSFIEQTGLNLSPIPGSTAWGDYDNDGDLDLLVAGIIDNTYPFDDYRSLIFKNNGDNSFTEQSNIYLSGITSGSAAWGDYDNDGDLDILITGSLTNSTSPENITLNPISKVYRNLGNDSFEEQTNINLTGVVSSSAAWGDYDNDGDLDIVLTGDAGIYPNFNAISKIYKNNGDNTFAEQTDIVLTGVDWGTSSWSDYDNDGDLDLLLSGGNDYGARISVIYRNDGNNVFTDIKADVRGVEMSSSSWGDFNNDGYSDILIAGSIGYGIVKIYQNDKNGGFFEVPNDFNVISTIVAWGDYDNDGDLDALGGNQIYHNNIDFPNQAPTAPGNLKSDLSGFDVKLSWDKSADPNHPDGSLYYNVRIGTSPGGLNIIAPMSDVSNGFRSISDIGNAQANNFLPLKNLARGIQYYWSVQAIDQSYKGGSWAAEQSFIVPNISASFNADSVCYGAQTNFTDLSQSPEEQIQTWFWDFGDGGGTSTLPNPKYNYGSAGSYEASLTVTSASYQHTITRTVLVKPSVKAMFDAPNVCLGKPMVITNNTQIAGLSISSWNWSFGDNSPDFTGQNPPQHNYLVDSAYIVKLKITLDNGCADSTSKEVIIGKIPSSIISTNGNSTFCAGTKFVMTAENYPNFKYEWRKNNIPLLDKTSSVIEIKDADESGIYKVFITNLLGNCSVNSTEYSVTVNSVPAAPSINSPSKTEICQGETVTLEVSQEPDINYQWFLNGGPLTDGKIATYNARLGGTYSVTATGANSCPVLSINEIDITVYAMPGNSNIQLSGSPSICPGEPVELYVENNLLLTYQWNKDGKLIDGATHSNYIANSEGDYSVQIVNNQCSVTSPLQPITEKAGPPIPEMYLRGDVVWYVACTALNGVSYKWFRNGDSIPNSNDYIIVPKPAEGIYYVELSNGGECASRSEDVKIPDDFKTKKFKSIENLPDYKDVQSTMTIYPNPSQGKFNLLIDNKYEGKLFFKIKDISGKTIRQNYAEKTENIFLEGIDLSKFGKGFYFMELNYGDKIETKKVVVE
jgi:PKD repeat protein